VYRDNIVHSLRELDPKGTEFRKKPYKKVHGRNFQTQGPNWLWAIDGHMKLARYGIQIYGAIDAYSRRIIWLYVGVDASTAISTARQFMDTVKQGNIIPFRIRADRGNETPIVGDLQYDLRRWTELRGGEISLQEFEDFPFIQTFLFGTSMRNQRIEAWWNKLEAHQLRPWKVRD
jgi:transposase InsO family protein